MMKLEASEIRGEGLPKIKSGTRRQGGELILKPGDPKLATKSILSKLMDFGRQRVV